MNTETVNLSHGSAGDGREFSRNISHLPQGYFGWLYRNLPPWSGRKHGPSELEALALTMRAEQRTDGSLEAGYTYFAQFLDHDLTFDPASLSQQIDDPELLHHYRTPALDLDCIYGRGPRVDPIFYSDEEPERFRITELTSGELDLPRIGNRAIVADVRNDDFIILSQLHLAVLSFHNSIVDWLKDQPELTPVPSLKRSSLLFQLARKLVRWHYQWIVLYDFLPKILHSDVYDRLNKRTLANLKTADQAPLVHFRWENAPYLPIEFTSAAFRFAHSLPRSSYRLNGLLGEELRAAVRHFGEEQANLPVVKSLGTPPKTDSEGIPNPDLERLRFIVSQLDSGALPAFTSTRPLTVAGRIVSMLDGIHPDLRGRRRLPENWNVDWHLFVDTPFLPRAQRAMSIGPEVSAPLFEIPIGPANHSLPALDLLKGWSQRLPSGQALARRMGIPPRHLLSESDISPKVDIDPYMRRETPLLYYILAEAACQTGGKTLGILGSEIVGEVLIGLLLADPSSFVNENPRWQPNPGRSYRLVDLLTRQFDEGALAGMSLTLPADRVG